MVERSDLEEVEAGDEFEWHCPECDNTFTRNVGKGIVMSLRTQGHVTLPCPVCEEMVELTFADLVDIIQEGSSEYDASDHYHA
jgi:rubrerythrin